MNIRERFHEIAKRLKEHYPDGSYSIEWSNDFELFVGIILSAQTRDVTTNRIIKQFPWKTFEQLANANISDVAEAIKPCGYYTRKAKLLVDGAKYIVQHFNGTLRGVPFQQLLKIPGIGLKSASFIAWKFNNEAYPVLDTHMIRVVKRWFWSELKTIQNINKLFNFIKQNAYPEDIIILNDTVVQFGREYCKSSSPKCNICFVNDLCEYFQEQRGD